MQPGWYDDPFARGWLRWWDGTAWTSQQMPHGATSAPSPSAGYAQPGARPFYGAFAPPSPQRDLDDERRWARYGTWAFVASAAMYCVLIAVAAPLLGHHIHRAWTSCQAQLDAGATNCQVNSLSLQGQVATNLFYLPLVSDIVTMIWLRTVAQVGRHIGLPARRSPTWAFGFFVPIVNLWFPYQVAADSLPPGDRRRSIVGWWWAFLLLTGVGMFAPFIVALNSESAGVVVGVVACALPILSAVWAVRMVRAISDAHRELLAPYA